MKYYYRAFGIVVASEIELPALLPVEAAATDEDAVQVILGKVPLELTQEGKRADSSAVCNANEMIFHLPERVKFYISNGNSIVIEPIAADLASQLIYFYSNALAAVLYQRNLIPFHVSGVFTGPGKVVLFAAPSGTGKSTMAVKLQEMGYRPFTDDTAILFVEEGKCFAQASYPMIRLWQETIGEQVLLNEADKQKIYDDGERDKFGFLFHDQFEDGKVEVEQLIFLEQVEGSMVEAREIRNVEAFKKLCDNVYRCHWIPAMKKGKVQFELISQILGAVPHWLAVRPKNAGFIEEFPQFIEKRFAKKGEIA
ncbi:hypothetical protein ABDK00_002835 [Niabella insulamsoli]|uniref:hypothetical protein n=1 Tax=Niabella insulamsoli TaxID=3144874 RepID=UPI0031FCDB3E